MHILMKRNLRLLGPVLVLILVISLILGTGIACSKFSVTDIKEDNTNSILKFVHLSDVHFDTKSSDSSRRLYSHSQDLLQDAVNQTNSFGDIDFVVFSGDSINRPSGADMAKFVKVINSLKAPWYLSTGNHEIGIKGGLSKYERLNIINRHCKHFKMDKSYYTFTPKKGYLVIVMDGVIDTKSTAHGLYSKKELSWLDKQLTVNKDSKVIIVQHFPLVEPFKSADHYILNSKEYNAILNKHNNVIAILSGHYHGSRVSKVGKIVHVSTPALVEYPNAFRIITISNKEDKVQVDIVTKETKLKNLQQMSKSRSKSWQLSQGKESDRNTTIIIDKE